MITNLRRLLGFAAFAAALTIAPLLPAAIAPAENLLPVDTLGFFTVPDVNAFRATCKTSPQLRLWDELAMKPFRDKFLAKWNEKFVAPLEKDLGIKVADFLALPQGQLTFAVTVNGSTGHDDLPPGLVLLLDAKKQSGALQTNLATLTKKWTDAGRVLRTEKINGLAFTVVPLTSNDFSGIFPKRPVVQELGKEPKPEKPGEIYFTQFESLLVAGNSAKAVEAVAAHLTGGRAPALANDTAFAADKTAQFRDAPVYYGWFNGKACFSLISQANDDSHDPNASPFKPQFSAGKILDATGLNGLKSASFAVRETTDGAAVTLHITAPEAGRTGLLKILALPPRDAAAPAFVPADVVKFSRLRLDGKLLWAELQKIVAGISPQGLIGLNAAIETANTLAQQKTPGFDLRTALFANLGDDLITYQKPPAGDSLAALSKPPTLILLAVANPDQVINAIQTVAGLAAPQDATATPREFLGKKIHTLALRAARNPATGAVNPNSLYVASSGGYLAFSADTAILEEYLRSAGSQNQPLRETAAMADVVRHLGTGGGLFGYENQRETMRLAFKLLKSSAEGDNSLKLLPPAVREWIDFSLLPDFAVVQKYFYISAYAGSANADGLTLKVFTPHPPQLN